MYNRNGKISKYCLISRQKISITLNLIMQFSIICLDFLFVVRSEIDLISPNPLSSCSVRIVLVSNIR